MITSKVFYSLICLLIISILAGCGADSPQPPAAPTAPTSGAIIVATPIAVETSAIAVSTATATDVKPTAIIVSTATATAVKPVEKTATCADIDANWGRDWPAVVAALEQLIAADETCGDEPLLSKKYATHFNYATTLENQGEYGSRN